MFIKDRVDNDRDERRKIRPCSHFGDEHKQGASLENGTATVHERSMASLHRRFHVHREMLKTVDFERLADTAKHEEDLHLYHVAARADWSIDIV